MCWHSWILQSSCSHYFRVTWLFELSRLLTLFLILCFVFCFLPFSQIIPTTGLWPDKQVACFKSKNQLALQMGEHTSRPFLLKKENIRHGFDFSFLLQATCTESNISKSFMDLGAFQIIQAHARQSKFYFKSHNF